MTAKEVRCERCENIIALGCGCPPGGSVPKAHPTSHPRQDWRRFPADTILISPTRYAHLPGACTHVSEEFVKAPRWGWIPAPAGPLGPLEQRLPGDRDRGQHRATGDPAVRGVRGVRENAMGRESRQERGRAETRNPISGYGKKYVTSTVRRSPRARGASGSARTSAAFDRPAGLYRPCWSRSRIRLRLRFWPARRAVRYVVNSSRVSRRWWQSRMLSSRPASCS